MKGRNYLVVCAVVAAVTANVLAEDKAKTSDPSGTWRWDYEMNGESFNDSMKLNLKDDGKVVGKFYGRDQTADVEDGKIEDGKLHAAISLDFNGTPIKLVFTGPIKGDEIAGNVKAEANGETYEFPWAPKRSVKKDDVVGQWDFVIIGNDNNFEPKVKISKEGDDLKLAYTTMNGDELDVKDLKLNDNQLSFTVTADFQGTPMKVDFKGRPYGDKVSGKVDYDFGGQTGETTFSGKRKAEKK